MSEVLEIRTGTEVSEVVERLARTMGDDTLCLPVTESVAEGEWVRFSVQLEDGTHVIEGVGRVGSAVPRGNPTDRYDLFLSDLSFDERNEIMYERMLIAKDAGKRGDDTGVIQLDDAAMEDVSGDDDVTTSSPPTPSVPPPPPAVPLEDTKAKKTSARPRGKLTTPGSAAKAGPTPASKKRASAAPKKRASTAPKRASTSAPDDGATKVDLKTPAPARKSSRPSRRPPVTDDGEYTLEVPAELVAHARRLGDRVPKRLLNRDRTPGKPEATVLKTAIRAGLAALESLADDE